MRLTSMMSQTEFAERKAYEEVCSFLVSENLCRTQTNPEIETTLVALTGWSLLVYNHR